MDSLRTQALGNEAAGDPPERVEGMLDINVLPQRYRPTRISFTTVLAWVLFAILVGLLYLSFLRFQEGTQQLNTQRLRFKAAQEALLAAEVQPAEIEALQAEIAGLTMEVDELESLLVEVNIQLVQWGPELRAVTTQAPTTVELTALEQDFEEVIISGRSANYQDPLDYRDFLAEVDKFADVQLLSVTRVELEEAEVEATPEATTESEATDAPIAEPTEQFVYEFQIFLTIPAADRPDPTAEVTQ